MVRSLQYAFIAIIVTTVGFSLYQWNQSRASTQKTAPNNGLVGYWSFNEGTGTQAGDASGNGNTGTLTNGPTWTTGKLGQAINFDGVNDYVNVPSPVITAYPGTISAWVKATGFGFVVSITDSGGAYQGWGISASPTGGQGFASNASPPDSYVNFSADVTQWTHITFVLTNATSRSLYVNGTFVGTATADKTPIGLSGLNIGRIGGSWAGCCSNPFPGQIDEVRIYNRALSGTEITNLYNLGAEKLNVSPVSNLTSGLVGYWTFDGKDTPWSSSSAGTATDRSGNSNTGTLTNMSQSTSVMRGKLGQALNFDGVDDYVITGNTTAFDSLFSSGLTFCTWAKFPNFSNYNRLITLENNAGTDYDAWIQTQQSSAIVQFGAGGYGNFKTSTTALSTNTWYYLCGVTDYTAGGTKIFINGTEDSGTLGGTPTYTSDKGTLDIGRLRATSSSHYGTGQIDEVRIYNRALSATEVQSLYDLGASDKVNSSVSQNQGTGRLDSGLAGYWKLDDASGTTATDSSTNANNGTLTNSPTWGTGRIGGDVVFTSASSQMITISHSTTLNVYPMTASAWVKTTTNDSASRGIVGKYKSGDGNGYLLYLYQGHIRGWYWKDISNAVTGGSPQGLDGGLINDGAWHFVSLVVDSSGGKLFVDGAQKGVGVWSGTSGVMTSTIPLCVGIFTTDNTCTAGSYFDGSIDEVRIYNRALSDDEVSQLYRLTTPTGVDTSLKGYWSFDGKATNWTSSSAGTVSDLSGSGNTGTLTNMSQSTSVIRGKLGQALNFDGVDDSVLVSSSSSLQFSGAVPITLSAWVKPSQVTGFGTFLIKGRDSVANSTNYAIRQDSTGKKLEFYFYNTSVSNYNVWATSSNVFPTSNIWYHVVVTYTFGTGGSMVAYVNGVSVAGTWIVRSGNDTADVDTQRLTIGRWLTTGTGELFTGQIDEVRIYNRALSSTEVSALYNAGR